MKKEDLNSEIAALIGSMAAEIRGYKKQVQKKIEGHEAMKRQYQAAIRDRDRYKALMEGETARADRNADRIDSMAAEIRGYEKQVQEKIEGDEAIERQYQAAIRDRDRYKALMEGETARADRNADLILRIRRNVTIANRDLMNAVLETN